MGELEIIGSRRRYVIEATGSRQTLVVRRIRCLDNVRRKIHHELPDILVPYKIHAAEILEKIHLTWSAKERRKIAVIGNECLKN
jgi:hypothetical protein